MNLFRNLDQIPENLRHAAVTIGNFDGVHRGHAQIIGRLLSLARQAGEPAVVFTFDPHPASLLRPGQAPTPLCWTDRKAQLLDELGVDAVVAYPTDESFLRLDAREFFDQIILGRLGTRAMVEGSNFFFGRGRSGTTGVLRQFCAEAGIVLDVVEPVEIDGAIVSSSRIRSLVASGQVEVARSLLTQPYRLRGKVDRGAGRGTGLGYPTANVAQIDTLLPSEGIYAGRTHTHGASWPAAISVGSNPTFGEDALKVEAHLIGFCGSLYDQPVEVDFLARLRDIQRFDSVEQLVTQMDRDVAAARQIVERHHTEQRP